MRAAKSRWLPIALQSVAIARAAYFGARAGGAELEQLAHESQDGSGSGRSAETPAP